jgi:autotransporter translocation and assembly factor TamB
MSGRIKWLKRILGGGLILLLLLVGAAAGGLYWLTSPSGQRMALGKALQLLNETFQGTFEAEKIGFSWDGRFYLNAVKIFSPHGEPVADIPQAAGRIQLLPLTKNKVLLSGFQIKTPVLTLVKSEQENWNLLQAFEPRKAPEQKKDSKPWTVSFSSLQIQDGKVSVVGLNQPLSLRSLNLDSQFTLEEQKLDIVVEKISLSLLQPVVRDISAQGKLQKIDSKILVPELSVTSSGSSLVAKGSFDFEGKIIDLHLQKVVVAPQDLYTYATLKSQLPWDLEGTVKGPLAELEANVSLETHQAGSATLQGKGNFDIPEPTYEALVNVKGVNPGQLGLSQPLEKGDINSNFEIKGIGIKTPQLSVDAQFKKSFYGATHIDDAGLKGTYSPNALHVDHVFAKGHDLELEGKGNVVRTEHGWIPTVSFNAKGKLDPKAKDKKKAGSFQVQANIQNLKFQADAQVKMGNGFPIGTAFSGEIDKKLTQVKFAKFKFNYPGTLWTLLSPFLVTIKPILTVQNLKLASGKSQITLTGSRNKDETFDVVTQLRQFNLATLPAILANKNVQITGVLNGKVHAWGTAAQPQLTTDIRLQKGELSVSRPGKLMRIRNIDLSSQIQLAKHDVEARITGSLEGIPVRLRAKTARRILKGGSLVGLPLEWDGEVSKARLEQLASFGAVVPEKLKALGGTLNIKTDGKGVWPKPFARLDVTASNARFNTWRDLSGKVTLETQKNGFNVKGDLWNTQAKLLTAIGSWTAQTPTSLPLSLPANVAQAAKGQSQLSVKFQDLQIVELLQKDAKNAVKGKLHGEIQLDGSLNAPLVTTQIQATELGPQKNGTANIALNYRNKFAEFSVNASAGPQNTLVASGGIPADLSLTALQNKTFYQTSSPIEAQASASMQDFSFLQALVPSVRSLSGTLIGDIKVAGSLQTPQWKGTLKLSEGHLAFQEGRTFNGIQSLVTFEGNDIILNDFRLTSGGLVLAKGTFSDVGSPLQKFEANLKTDDFILEPARYPSTTLDSQIRLAGFVTGEKIDAKVNVDSFRVWIPSLTKNNDVQSLNRSPDITVVRTQTTPAQVMEQKRVEQEPGRTLHVAVLAPRNIWLLGPEISLELRTNLDITQNEGPMRFVGDISAVRAGDLEVFSRKFKLETVGVTFMNTEVTRGKLNIDAIHDAKEAKVQVGIRGEVRKPQILLRSEPARSDFEIMALLIAGPRSPNEGGAGQSSMQGEATSLVSSALTGFVSDRLQGFLSTRTPLTVNLEMQDAAEGRGTVELGQYVNPDLFVSYDRQFGAELGENTNEIRFDYTLTRRWSLEGFFGDAQEGGLDLFWRMRF